MLARHAIHEKMKYSFKYDCLYWFLVSFALYVQHTKTKKPQIPFVCLALRHIRVYDLDSDEGFKIIFSLKTI